MRVEGRGHGGGGRGSMGRRAHLIDNIGTSPSELEWIRPLVSIFNVRESRALQSNLATGERPAEDDREGRG